jgi:hypothetical protein
MRKFLCLLALALAFVPLSALAVDPVAVSLCELDLVDSHLTYESVTVDGLVNKVPAPLVTRVQFLAALGPVGLNTEARVLDALAQAERSHANQPRRDGGSYLEQHIMPVALSALREWHYNAAVSADVSKVDIVIAAILHDVLEDDRSLNPTIIAARFGADVASIVSTLTKPVIKLDGFDKIRAKWFKNFIYVSRLGRSRPAALAIKMADRLNNIVSTLALLDQFGVREVANGTSSDGEGSGYGSLSANARDAVFYVLETHEFYEPLALRFSYHYYLRLRFVLDRIRTKITAVGPWDATAAELRDKILQAP